ncbi:pyridoxamine 5'-phosphate oxidase family protein, partial [Planktomarina temperata]|nr:pyridoxamine 5'-phosphate oxidase family protein [Planktomarina temperata]
MEKRTGIFDGNDPFALARDWMSAAEAGELNDPNAMALSTVDRNGMPNARIVLLKSIEDGGFVFY